MSVIDEFIAECFEYPRKICVVCNIHFKNQVIKL